MAAAGVLKCAAGWVGTGVEHGDEGRGVRDLFDDTVEVFEDGGRAAEFTGAETQSYGEGGHEKRCRGAFAGDVGDDDIDNLVGDLEEVVVVAAEETGGLHGGGEFDAGHDGGLG